jgi:hypothetical protein
VFLSREDSESGASQEAWTGSVQGGLANAKSWFDRLLTGMVEAGLGIPALCLYLTLSESDLLARVVALGLPTPHDRPIRRAGGRNPWTAAEIRQLIEWWGDGIRVSRIAEALGRSKSGIYYKKRRLGLPARDRKSLTDRNPLDGSDVCLGAGVAAIEQPGPASATGFVDLVTWWERAERGDVERVNREHAAAESNCRGSDVAAAPGLGTVRLGTASPELLAAIQEAQRIANKQTGGERPDWTRVDLSEDEVFELALRGFAGQSRFGIARDMGISAQAAADRLTRLGMRSVREEWRSHGWRKNVETFDVEIGLERMETSGSRATVCDELRTLFFVGPQDRANVHRCPEWHRKFSDEARERRLCRERKAREKAENEGMARRKSSVERSVEGNPPRLGRDLAELQRIETRLNERYLAGLEKAIAAFEAELESDASRCLAA